MEPYYIIKYTDIPPSSVSLILVRRVIM